MYLDYYNRTNKNGNSYTVRPEEEKTIVVDENYIWKNSNFTKEEYKAIELRRQERSKRKKIEREKLIEEEKKSKIDDDLGMSF